MNRKNRSYPIIILAIILIFAGISILLRNNYYSPKSVFWGMLNNSLSDDSVTRHVTETVNGQSLDEYITLELGKHNIAQSYTNLIQSGNEVSTETIGTPTVDYTKYISAKTNVKNPEGQSLSFKNIIGVWSKSPVSAESSDPLDHLFGQTLLGIVPIANLPVNEKNNLLNLIKSNNVFSTNFSNIKKKVINGLPVDVYNIKINPVGYAKLLNLFASYESYKNVPELNPNSYENDGSLQVQFAINPSSRQLVEINYTNTNHIETYGNYNTMPIINIPKNTITTSELEQRLLQLE